MFFSILAHFSDDNEKNTICEKYNWDDVVEETMKLYRGEK